MKKNVILFVYFILSFTYLFPMNSENVNGYEFKDKPIKYEKVFEELYEQVKKYCKTASYSNLGETVIVSVLLDCCSKKHRGETKILSTFLSFCPKEPEVSLIKRILKECVKQNVKFVLFACIKKEFWNIAEYIFDNFKLKKNDVKYLLFYLAKFGKVKFFKRIFYSKEFLFIDQESGKIKNEDFAENLMFYVIEGVGSKDILELILRAGGNFDKNLFFYMIKRGHIHLIMFCFECSSKLKEDIKQGKLFCEKGYNLLDYAVVNEQNKLEIVRLMLSCGVKASRENKKDYTPLQTLLFCSDYFVQEDLEVVDLLLSQEGYYANEIPVTFLRDNIFPPVKGYFFNVMLDKIEKRQKEAKNLLKFEEVRGCPNKFYSGGFESLVDQEDKLKTKTVQCEPKSILKKNKSVSGRTMKKRVTFYIPSNVNDECNCFSDSEGEIQDFFEI